MNTIYGFPKYAELIAEQYQSKLNRGQINEKHYL